MISTRGGTQIQNLESDLKNREVDVTYVTT